MEIQIILLAYGLSRNLVCTMRTPSNSVKYVSFAMDFMTNTGRNSLFVLGLIFKLVSSDSKMSTWDRHVVNMELDA